LEKLHLNPEHTIVIADGRAVSSEDTIRAGAEVTVLPRIAGG
jgi:sulfur carrier protein ThiS